MFRLEWSKYLRKLVLSFKYYIFLEGYFLFKFNVLFRLELWRRFGLGVIDLYYVVVFILFFFFRVYFWVIKVMEFLRYNRKLGCGRFWFDVYYFIWLCLLVVGSYGFWIWGDNNVFLVRLKCLRVWDVLGWYKV